MAQMSELELVVTPLQGEVLRFTVHSETEDDSAHVVDLTLRKGNGECSCQDFAMRRGPNLHKNGGTIVNYGRDKKGRIRPEATRCKHINEALLYVGTMAAKEAQVRGENQAKPVTIKEADDGLPF